MVQVPGWRREPCLTVTGREPGPCGSTRWIDGDGIWRIGNHLGRKPREIPDGLSRTLAVSEVVGYDSPQDARGGWVMYAMGSACFSAKTPPNSRPPEHLILNPDTPDLTSPEDYCDHLAICEENIPAANALHCIEHRPDDDTWAAARSRHRGGVNGLMCDGSVHFFQDNIELVVWRALATRAGDERTPPLE